MGGPETGVMFDSLVDIGHLDVNCDDGAHYCGRDLRDGVVGEPLSAKGDM